MNQLATQKDDPWQPPCTIYDLPAEAYFAIPAASSHFLSKLLDESPLHAREAPDKPSKSKDLGTLAHGLLLEPARTEREIVIRPPGLGKASNAAKRDLVIWICEVLDVHPPEIDEKDQATGKPLAEGKRHDARLAILEPMLDEAGLWVVTEGQLAIARTMRENVLAKPLGRVIFESGRAEVTKLAVDPRTGELCRIRIDWEPDGHHLLVDVKTARNISYSGFARDAGSFRYHVQAAMYRRIDALAREEPGNQKDFLHVLLENEPPYDCAFRAMDEKTLEAGRIRWEQAMNIYAACQATGTWPSTGYNKEAFMARGQVEYEVEPFGIPPWSL